METRNGLVMDYTTIAAQLAWFRCVPHSQPIKWTGREEERQRKQSGSE